jgi:SAM-dependent methyltransferase
MLVDKLQTSTRFCPICGNRQIELLTQIDFLLFPESLLPNHYDIVACHFCGFVFNDTNATQADFNRYYALQSKYDLASIEGIDGFSSPNRERYMKITGFLDSALPSASASIIDIGCGRGGLLKMLKGKGFHNLFGIDPSKVCVRLFNNDGIHASQDNLFTFNPNQKFDVAILTGVLEHIFDLGVAADKLSAILTREGLLLVEVPDASRYLGYDSTPFYRFDFEHINHFSLPHLQNLFGLHNFKLVSHLLTDNKVSQNSFSPTIIALFSRSNQSFFEPDFSLEKDIADYIVQSHRLEDNETIERLARSGRSLLVWGLGAYTARLLKQTRLSQCNIVAFIDNSPHKQGKLFLNRPVYSSQKLSDFAEPAPLLVICSVLYSMEMQEFIRKINYKGEVICLI